MLNKNGQEVKPEQLTPETYLVPKGEEKLMHVVQDQVQFSPNTGNKVSIARVQKYGVRTWKQVLHDLKIRNFTFTILHDGEKWTKENAARIESNKRIYAERAKSAADELAQKNLQEAVDLQTRGMKEDFEKQIKELNEQLQEIKKSAKKNSKKSAENGSDDSKKESKEITTEESDGEESTK